MLIAEAPKLKSTFIRQYGRQATQKRQ